MIQRMVRLAKLIFISLLLAMKAADADTLYLQQFYGASPPKYDWVFGADATCTPMLPGSQMRSPTKPAVRGLEAALAGNIALAKQCELELKKFGHEKHASLFFVFTQDYIDRWPYYIYAPWSSSLTQGVALGLYMALARATGEPYYKNQARKIFASYLIPLERGGFVRSTASGAILEEYPAHTKIAVLNGGLVSAIALKDYADWTKDEKAEALFQQAAHWFDRNISEYDVKMPNGQHISAYSLAKQRLEILFRFAWATGKVEIDNISIAAPEFSYDIPVGDLRTDQKRTRSASLIVSSTMNWTQPLVHGGRRIRTIQPGLGDFDHAPFTVQVTSAEDFQRWASGVKVAVTYRSFGEVILQINDGLEYHNIAKLTPSPEFRTDEFIVPQAAIKAIKFPTNKVVNNIYAGYNQQLTEILGKITGSQNLLDYSQLWKQTSPSSSQVNATPKITQ